MNLDYVDFKMHADEANYTFRCFQVACDPDDDTLSLAAVVGSQTAVKSFAAALNGGKNAEFSLPAGSLRTASGGSHSFYRLYKQKGQGNYHCKLHRLGYSTFHCVALLKDPQFLPVADDNALWNALTASRYTTPLLREWIPYLRRELETSDAPGRGKPLVPHAAFGCAPATLRVLTPDLDELVQDGLAAGRITIPDTSQGDAA